MTLYQSLIIGVVQGLTEFIPISSTGHLVLTPFFLRWDIPPREAFIFNILVQVATLVAVFIYFRRDLGVIIAAALDGIRKGQPFSSPESRLGWYIIIATIPAGLVGLLFRDGLESVFNSPIHAALSLQVTAGLLLIAEKLGKRQLNIGQIRFLDALVIGFFQVLALFPGVSRSGATISGGMLRNLERPAAARFSFMMSIPIMLAAGLIAAIDLLNVPNFHEVLPAFIPGFLASALFGYLAIRWLISFVSRYPLYVFSLYCFSLSVFTLVLIALGYG